MLNDSSAFQEYEVMKSISEIQFGDRIEGCGESRGKTVSRTGAFFYHVRVLLLGCAAVTFSGPAALAQSVRRAVVSQSLPVQVSSEAVEVTVPVGCVSCVVEARLRRQKTWVRWRSFATKAGDTKVRFVPPRGSGTAGALVEEWRATGTVDVAQAEKRGVSRKYPAKFYQGARNFKAGPAAGYKSGIRSSASGNSVPVDGPPVMMLASTTASNSTRVASQDTANTVAKDTTKAATEAVEADIWKTDGSTVYFFNQLRGLQVVDVSDPSRPLMRARLRLPAVGQDLYLLPEQTPGERLVVLLTRAYDDASGSQSEVVVVRVSGTAAEIVSRQMVAGSLQDSRMVGSRLYMVNSDWNLYWRNYNRPRIRSVAVDAQGAIIPGSEAAEADLSNTTLSELVVGSDGSIQRSASLPVPSSSSSALIAAGGDWLAVASDDWSEWDKTQISLYRLSESGATLLTPKPIRTQGRVYDKFKIGFQKDTLMAVTQRWDTQTASSPQVVTLECFDSSGAEITKLEIKRGENLYATRFGPEKLYVVTAVNHDPLWVVDISDPRNPGVGGHVEVPGFSTYIQPVGDDGRYLFTIGLESGRVVASLFDVSDPANPVLPENGRVQVSDAWGYSQSVWDEKALKVLPEEGLALIPFVSGWPNSRNAFVRLVDIDLTNGGSLKLRGRLNHDFAPQRATMTNGVLTSISQKELITAGVADRDNPAVLAEVALAWPVNQVLQTGNYLLQIGDGSSALWSNEPASLTVSRTDAEDTVLQTVDLGAGTVCDATVRGSKLYVLRKSGAPYWYGIPMMARVSLAVIDAKPLGSPDADPNFSGLFLDVYDISALPFVQRMGSVSTPVRGEDLGDSIGGLLWINETTPAVLTQGQSWNWDWWYPQPVKISASGVRIARPRRLFTPNPAVVRAFDVRDPSVPSAYDPVVLNAVTETMVSVSAAGDGLFVYAYGEGASPVSISGLIKEGEEPLSATHRLGVVDFAAPSNPVVRSPLQMPGRVFAITDLSRSGFLAYTETMLPATRLSKPVRQVQVSVVDEQQAFLVASMAIGWNAVLAAEGRSLYVADGGAASRFTLSDAGVFTSVASVSIGWTPTELQTRGLTVLGISGNNLLRIGWNGLNPALETWKMRQGFGLSKMTVGVDGSLYAPMGDFGVERYQPK